MRKENHSWRHHNAGLQVVLQSCAHQDGVVLAQKTDTQINGTEETNPEVDPQLYSQDRTFDQAGKTIRWKKDSLFTKGCWTRWTATRRGVKLDRSLTPPDTKRNSKWMEDLNGRQDSIKLLGENTGNNTLLELGHSNFLQDTSMKARETEPK